MLTQQEDIKFGTGHEQSMKASIERLVGCPLNSLGGYSIFDYINDNSTVFVELKSRRIKHNDYATAIVGLNKVRAACEDPTKSYYFCFNYTDGLYYIKFEKNVFNDFTHNENYWRSNRNDCENRSNAIVFIPVERLTKV